MAEITFEWQSKLGKCFFQCENVENKIANVKLERSDGQELAEDYLKLIVPRCQSVSSLKCNGPSSLRIFHLKSQTLELRFISSYFQYNTICAVYTGCL